MAYVKQNFKAGDVVSAEQLNKMETALAEAYSMAEKSRIDTYRVFDNIALSTTQKTATSLNGRKISDYAAMLIIFQTGTTVRISAMMPSTMMILPSVLPYSYGGSIGTLDIEYVSDTSIRAKASHNGTLVIYGLKNWA